MGTEALWVPLALAAVSGGAQYANQSAANSRQQAAETQSIQDQQQLEQKATGAAAQLTKQIGQDNPSTIANSATGQYVAQLRKAAAGAAPGAGANTQSALVPGGNTSKRYTADANAGAADVENYGQGLSTDMGNIDAAVRQRQNESTAMGTLQTGLNGLGAQSYTKNFVDQLKAATAGQTNPWVGLGSSLLGNYANYASKKTPTMDETSTDPYTGASFTIAS